MGLSPVLQIFRPQIPSRDVLIFGPDSPRSLWCWNLNNFSSRGQAWLQPPELSLRLSVAILLLTTAVEFEELSLSADIRLCLYAGFWCTSLVCFVLKRLPSLFWKHDQA